MELETIVVGYWIPVVYCCEVEAWIVVVPIRLSVGYVVVVVAPVGLN